MFKERRMSSLTLATVLPLFRQHIYEMQSWQIVDPAHPDFGAIVYPDYGIADAKASGNFVTGCAYLALGQGEVETALLERASLAADYMLKAQRPSGLIDLLSVNYD